jgi:pimeloyl-ACP methyl ester carboxylesterase
MNDTLHRTDTICAVKEVTCGEQKQHWVEFQLLDEQGEPMANMPYRAVNEATRTAYIPEFTGQSDAQGLIRIDGLHPIPITLLMRADPLAEQLQTRRLRAVRPEPRRPGVGDRTPLHGPQRPGFSPLEQQAHGAGHAYHYLRIGQLCDQLPTFDPPLADPEHPPAYHFPDPEYGGFTVSGDDLDRRHIVEICPLRAWSLVLHHQEQYSLANAYNLGLMSILSYSAVPEKVRGSVRDFFERQCVDLSRTPEVWADNTSQPCLVQDVPFNNRYITAESLDTSQAEPPEGHTQLFYALSASQVLVSWRGTEMGWPFSDLLTDLTFRPVKPEVEAHCEPKVPCSNLASAGSVHLGFRDAYEVARRVYAKDLGAIIPYEALDKQLYICGHSLGGALGLIHAAALKDKKPLLYTYGMPRTFTLKAMASLSEVQHFRHVNDIDTIPSVPPEAELDNYLYDLYGPVGTILGFTWSLARLLSSPLFKYEDPFCHHGEIAMFYRTAQHMEQQGSSYAAYRSKDGLGAPYYNSIAYRLPKEAKLYLVPSLDKDADKEVEEGAERFQKALTRETRARYFAPHGNARSGRLTGILKHFMSEYQPYLYKQLLEAIKPDRDPLLELQVERQAFEQQLKEYASRIPKEELGISRQFLDLQRQLGRALDITRNTEGGHDALLRFDAVADAKANYAKTYG